MEIFVDEPDPVDPGDPVDIGDIGDTGDPGEAGWPAKLAAPLVAGTAVWAVRRALDSVYRRATGHSAPNAGDPQAPLRKIVIWAGVTAAAVSAVNVVVDRTILRPRVRPGINGAPDMRHDPGIATMPLSGGTDALVAEE